MPQVGKGKTWPKLNRRRGFGVDDDCFFLSFPSDGRSSAFSLLFPIIALLLGVLSGRMQSPTPKSSAIVASKCSNLLTDSLPLGRQNSSDTFDKKKATLAAPLLAGKPPQHRSVRRGRNALTPAAVSRAQGRPTSPIPRAVATEEKVVAGRIDVASASLASSPEVEQKQRLVPEVADLEDILAERDACGVSVCFYLFFCLCSWIGIGDWPRR